MRIFKRVIVLSIFPLLVTFGKNKKEEKEKIPVPAEVEAIDPYSEDAGDFFDVDILHYAKGAYQAYQDQDYELSAKYYLAYLEHNVDEDGALYNLACCYGLLGADEQAAEYLLRAVNAGFEDVEHIKKDPDFDPVRESEVFAAVMDSLVTVADAEKSKEGKIVHIPADAYFKSHVHFPADFNPDSSYTLLVGLHGWGAKPERFVQLWYRFGDNPDFIYVAPQAPYAFEIGDMGYSWDTWIPDDSLLAVDVGLRTEQYVLDVIEYFKDAYNIDHVFLTGFSQGGGYTYQIGLKHHELFSGIMPLGGWMDVNWIGAGNLDEAKGLPVFIGHGEKDMRVEFKVAQEAYETLEKLNYDVTLFTFDGGHSVPEEECQALVEWMTNKR